MKILLKWIIICSILIDAIALYAYFYSRNTYYQVQFEKMIPIIIITTIVLIIASIVRFLICKRDKKDS